MMKGYKKIVSDHVGNLYYAPLQFCYSAIFYSIDIIAVSMATGQLHKKDL